MLGVAHQTKLINNSMLMFNRRCILFIHLITYATKFMCIVKIKSKRKDVVC